MAAVRVLETRVERRASSSLVSLTKCGFSLISEHCPTTVGVLV